MMKQMIFRSEQLAQLKEVVGQDNVKNVFLVRANKSYFNSGADVFIKELIIDTPYVSFFEFDPNPQLEDLKKGIELFRSKDFDLIIAIGGGSVLDMAKLISVFAHQQAPYEDLVLGRKAITDKKTPLLAIPTTAGTGAEATQFSVLYMDKNKFSVADPNFLPDYVYLSSDFSISAPKYLMACTGLDVFSQAVESLWSVNANKESAQYALEAIEIIWNNLYLAVNENDVVAKSKMQEASFLAGKAINITKTTAAHALSYAFTSYYSIPHGHAVVLTLPFFLDYNYNLTNNDCIDPNGVNSVKERIEKIFDIMKKKPEDAKGEMIAFFDSLGININTKTLISGFDPKLIASNVNIERLSNNPRIVKEEDILSIFE